MIRRKQWATLFWLVLLPWSLHGQARQWRDVSGNRVEGEITSREADSITLRLTDGSSLVIPMNNLSAEDRSIAFAWHPPQGNAKLVFGLPWKLLSLNLKMAWIPPGSFRQGSTVLEEGRGEDESLREVVIGRGFWLSQREVTQAQWAVVMEEVPGDEEGDELPVVGITREQADTFCVKITKRARANGALPRGYLYSLPSEAQWEYACRAGAVSAFCHGNEAGGLDKYAWTIENAKSKTHPVGELRPNRWGLYDMHGNALEWCRDFYGEYHKTKIVNPTGPRAGKEFVARGGSVLHPRLDCRSAKRHKRKFGDKDMIGLRIALTQVWR